MSKCLKLYFVFTACILLLYGCSFLIARFVYPYPPLAVTFPWMFSWMFFSPHQSVQSVLLLSGVVGAACHAGLFLLLNRYVLRRAARHVALPPAQAFLPSRVAVILILVLSVLYWLLAGRSGLRLQGPAYLLLYGILNIVTLFGLIVTEKLIVKRLSYCQTKQSNVAVLCYNFAVHAAMLFILFPYMGETL